jgi:hypothetical protein
MDSRGFKFDGKSERFIRGSGNGAHYFIPVFTASAGTLGIAPTGCIRIDAIELLSNKISVLPPVEQATTFTIGIDLWSYFKNPSLTYSVSLDSDLSNLRNALIGAFDDYVSGYFLEFDSISKIDSLLNDKPDEVCPHRPMRWLHAVTGLATAKVVGRANFEELEGVYRNQLKTISNGPYLKFFDRLVSESK